MRHQKKDPIIPANPFITICHFNNESSKEK